MNNENIDHARTKVFKSTSITATAIIAVVVIVLMLLQVNVFGR